MKEKDDIEEYGQITTSNNHKIQVVSIIGEIEGHECLPATSKTTKYEHILPQLVSWEMNDEIEAILFVINTVGGDVAAGLAIAEMINSMKKPTVSLVIGDSHSIGVPLAVAAKYSFIAPSATMIIHPVRMNGLIIGAPQTYDYFKMIQDRIVKFISKHSKIQQKEIEKMMFNKGVLTKDLGTILVGEDAVEKGLINEVGGLKEVIEHIEKML
ncbi:MAG: ATP-dependent Clp protease proteolytic subunit [Lachnospiraceae bacterium]|nr:ATP-dependent Clp protease proteolytic subunit [Lachnospiraceae bacterium]